MSAAIAMPGNSAIRVEEPLPTWPREELDLAHQYLSMALAEAGYRVEWQWDDEAGKYASTRPAADLAIPREVMDRARALVLDRLGRSYRYRPAPGSVEGEQ